MNWILILFFLVGVEWCSGDVTFKKAAGCVEEFFYRGKKYTNCIGVGISSGNQWCSLDRFYAGKGRWAYCTKHEIINYPSSCKEYQVPKPSGIYKLQIGKTAKEVYCDMSDSSCDAWIVIQRRINGDVSFNRSWTEYKNGFGDLNGNFWIGNDKLHELTSAAPMKIRFDVWDKDDNHKYAEYNKFYVASESDNYRLSITGYRFYAGYGGDPMYYHDTMPFSTRDRDNDFRQGKSCSKDYNGYGGWWYYECARANPNGQYLTPGTSGENTIFWHTFRGYFALKKIIIKIAKK